MSDSVRKAGVAGGTLALALALTGGGVLAQEVGGRHGPGNAMPLKGIVQALSGGSFQLNTGSTFVPLSFGTNTRVQTVVSGSAADLTKGARVDLQFASGGGKVKAVTVGSAFTGGPRGAGGSTGPGWAGRHHDDHPGKPGSGAIRTGNGTPKHARPMKTAWAHADGTVISYDASTGALKLQGPGGMTATFTIPAGATVTKIVSGSTADLQNGETVQVFATNGTARFIEILSG